MIDVDRDPRSSPYFYGRSQFATTPSRRRAKPTPRPRRPRRRDRRAKPALQLQRPRKRDHPIYQVWNQMRFYARSRRLGVEDRWLTFEGFLADMGDRPAGMMFKRIDQAKGFTRTNCAWRPDRRKASATS